MTTSVAKLKMQSWSRTPLTIEMILGWADAFHERFGRWPTKQAGKSCLPAGGTWSGIDACLKGGYRGLTRGSSLAKLLLKWRGRRHNLLLPPLTRTLILAWADAHYRRTGEWPIQHTGEIVGVPGETWLGVDCSLRDGRRELPGGSSLAQLLEAERNVRNHLNLPALDEMQILAWMDAHYERTGDWPHQISGVVEGGSGESWASVDQALRHGGRGLPGGSSLARLLEKKRGVRNSAAVSPLGVSDILKWADAHRARTGEWPVASSGVVAESPQDSWMAIDSALWAGTRTLPGGDSLARLLARKRKKRNTADLAPLRIEQILAWADSYHLRTGEWPTKDSGAIPEAPNETWFTIVKAAYKGTRGLPLGTSLPRLLETERGVRNMANLKPISEQIILNWADEHHTRTGQWPIKTSGTIFGTDGETWSAVATALQKGCRGLQGGCSLAQFLSKHRGVRNHMELPALTIAEILDWADAFHERTGSWPTARSGVIPEAEGETWQSVDRALACGSRGLLGRDTLPRLLARHRGKRNRKALPPHTIARIHRWIRQHYRRTGEWPDNKGKAIASATGETWAGVDQALARGLRGLPGGSSLAIEVRKCKAVSSRT